MSNELTPMKRVDKNGHTVTRWVRVLDSGEPAIDIPAAKVALQSPVAAEVMSGLFPDFNEETGMPVTAFGDDSFTSYEFSEHAIQSLPLKTLKGLLTKLDTKDTSGAQCHLIRAVYVYIEAMLHHATDDTVEEEYKRQVRFLNNAITFHDAFSSVYEKKGYHASAGQASGVIRRSLNFFGDDTATSPSHGEAEILIDYSEVDDETQARACGAVMAYVLSGRFAEERHRDLMTLMGDYPNDQQRIIDLVEERQSVNVTVLRDLLTHDAPAISDGVL